LVGPGRTKSIALRSALGGGIASIGPLVAGFLLQYFYWGSVFLITLPLAVVAVVMAWLFVPANVNESTEPVDNIGGVLSIVLVGSLILSINFAPVPNKGALTLVLAVLAAAALIGFYLRQRRARNPLYDLDVAARPTFWVAACAGIIVFGSLMVPRSSASSTCRTSSVTQPWKPVLPSCLRSWPSAHLDGPRPRPSCPTATAQRTNPNTREPTSLPASVQACAHQPTPIWLPRKRGQLQSHGDRAVRRQPKKQRSW